MSEPTHRFGDPPPVPASAMDPPKKSWLPTCLIGCLVMFVLMVVVGGGAMWWLVKKGPAMAAEWARTGISTMIQESDLPEEDKQQVTAQVNRLVDGFKNGEITGEQMASAIQKVVQSPVMAGFIVAGIKAKYVDGATNWSAEEKEAATRSLERLWRGTDEGSISMNDLEPLMGIVATRNGESWQMKNSLTDEEVRQFVAKSTEIADQAGIPDEPYPISIAETVKKMVDEIFNEISPEAADVEIPDEAAMESVEEAEPAAP